MQASPAADLFLGPSRLSKPKQAGRPKILLAQPLEYSIHRTVDKAGKKQIYHIDE